MKFSKGLAVAGVALALSIGATTANAQKRVKWKMQSTWASNLPSLGTSGVKFVDMIDKMSDGKFQIKFFEPNALVPSLECFDAISKGSIESCWTTPGYHTGKYPALAFFTAVPFGPSLGEFQAWKRFGGGNELRNEIYAKHNLIALDNFCIGPETSGWFREPITSLDQLKGMKMRFFGLGAQVMQRLGVSTQLLAGADIYPALEKGVIDATEFSMPTTDIKYGFYQIAKYNYFPGWHQQISCSEFLMNKESYDALPEPFKVMITAALGETTVDTYAETEATNFGAMAEMRDKHGVTVKRWGDDELAAFEKAWLQVLEEESSKDELFKKVADSYLSFREQYKIWGSAQSLAPTYLQ